MENLLVRAYARVSTDEQAQSGYSLGAQRDSLDLYARSQGWQIAGHYVDDGYSAKDMNRPALRRMLAEVQPGEVILVHRLDRLTRSVLDLHELLKTFEATGALLRSATEAYLDTTDSRGRLMLNFIAILAQWERESISERTRLGKRKKAEIGEWAGGPVPFGYQGEPTGPLRAGRQLLRLAPDPERAHLVRWLFERYLSGYGLRALCLWLNDELQVRTVGGARWRVSSLSRLLTNPLYAGFVSHGRRAGGAAAVIAQGAHQPLVPPDLFDQVQAVFARRKQAAPRQATGGYPLSGAARCGICGGRIDALRRRGTVRYLYRCANHTNGLGCGVGGQPPLKGVEGATAEAQLVAALASLPVPNDLPRFRDWCLQEAIAPPALAQAEERRMRRELAGVGRSIDRWNQGYERGGLGWDEYLARTGPLRVRAETLKQQLCAASTRNQPTATVRQVSVPRNGTPPAGPALPAGKDPLCAEGALDLPWIWRHLEPAERKAWVQAATVAYGVRILLHPTRTLTLDPHP